MTLFYCIHCGAVFVFNLFDIRKHGLERVEDKNCRVCGSRTPFLPLEEEELRCSNLSKP